jgi:predicted RecA/RadA family phage recombinase
MTDKYVQRGEVVTWTNSGSAVAAGAVVKMQNMVGVALTDIGAGASGSVAIEGVFTVPKASGAVFVQGEKLLWDVSAGNFDDSAATPATGDVMGAVVAMAAGANGETTCTVKLTPGNTTVT